MSLDLSALQNEPRLRLEVPLRVAQGTRFQPTGFPDLGAATYQGPPKQTNGGETQTQCLLVESAQSMANRLEATIWDDANRALIPEAQGLSYVRVRDENKDHLTSSIEEAHRLNSAYIEKANKGSLHEQLKKEMGANGKRGVDRKTFVQTLLKYDINSLIHGVFLESIEGRLRIARALSAFVEAEQIETAPSGGVKNDVVMPSKSSENERTASEGYGNVPFPREEFTAQAITAYFNLDVAQIRGYGLGDDVNHLLIVLALYKVQALLRDAMRLRTACELEVDTDDPDNLTRCVTRPRDGFTMPSLDALAAELPKAIQQCQDRFAEKSGVTEVTHKL